MRWRSNINDALSVRTYGSIEELGELEYLSHTTDGVLDEFTEYAE